MDNGIADTVNMLEIFQEAQKGKYAILAFHVHNLETFQVIDINYPHKYIISEMSGSNGKA